jgi:DNA repair protein SbcC/Rad50
MLIKSLRLSNIRSYESQEIIFPEGSVLLSGDIGAGKSTILIAIEFAIFGAKKGELPAYTLLRHGKKEGSVELKASIDGREVIVKRTLKRSNSDIRQDAGYLIVNGAKREGTSEELRAWLLDMMGYPKELIKKGKDLIYRYTVYTPQEEMRQILYESKDIRLDTLRKVFNIDKYKRIKENSKIIISQLREKKKMLEGFSLDLDYKLKEFEARKKESVDVEKRINEALPKLSEIKMIIDGKKSSLAGIEKEIMQLNELKKELSGAESALSIRIDQNNRLNEDIRKIDSAIVDLEIELKGKEHGKVDFDSQVIAKENELDLAEQEYL